MLIVNLYSSFHSKAKAWQFNQALIVISGNWDTVVDWLHLGMGFTFFTLAGEQKLCLLQ
jgi:hypothetical protein